MIYNYWWLLYWYNNCLGSDDYWLVQTTVQHSFTTRGHLCCDWLHSALQLLKMSEDFVVKTAPIGKEIYKFKKLQLVSDSFFFSQGVQEKFHWKAIFYPRLFYLLCNMDLIDHTMKNKVGLLYNKCLHTWTNITTLLSKLEQLDIWIYLIF